MKILHLMGEKEDIGGVFSVIRDIDQGTRASGFTHAVWVGTGFVEQRRPPLEYRFSKTLGAESQSFIRILVRAALGAIELRELLRREPFDLLHAHMRAPFLIAWIMASFVKIPALLTTHGYARRTGLYQRLARHPRLHTVLLTPNMARHYGIDPNAPRLRIISACCADRYFELPLAQPCAGPFTPDRPLRFIGLGNIVRWKNWHLALAALSRLSPEELKKVEFDHWGPVPNDPETRAYAGELNQLLSKSRLQSRVRFNGSTQEIPVQLRQSDWFLLPSTNEPCSVALMEALAAGLPALVSESGGNIDIMTPPTTGLLFNPESVDDLAGKIRLILNDQARTGPPGAIRESVRPRSASSVASQYAKLYIQVLGKKESTRHAQRAIEHGTWNRRK